MIDLKALREKLAEPGVGNEFGDDCEELLDLVDAQARDLAVFRAQLAAGHALVDALTGALLAQEWINGQCPACLGCTFVFMKQAPGHESTCPTDAALTLAGFPDQASRDAERARRRTVAQIQANVAAAKAECLLEGSPAAAEGLDMFGDAMRVEAKRCIVRINRPDGSTDYLRDNDDGESRIGVFPADVAAELAAERNRVHGPRGFLYTVKRASKLAGWP